MRRMNRDTMFFSKCAERKTIDYVLVYGRDTNNDKEKNDKRLEYEEGLVEAGIELEHEDIEVCGITGQIWQRTPNDILRDADPYLQARREPCSRARETLSRGPIHPFCMS